MNHFARSALSIAVLSLLGVQGYALSKPSPCKSGVSLVVCRRDISAMIYHDYRDGSLGRPGTDQAINRYNRLWHELYPHAHMQGWSWHYGTPQFSAIESVWGKLPQGRKALAPYYAALEQQNVELAHIQAGEYVDDLNFREFKGVMNDSPFFNPFYLNLKKMKTKTVVEAKYSGTYFTKANSGATRAQNLVQVDISKIAPINNKAYVGVSLYGAATSKGGYMKGVLTGPENRKQQPAYVDFKQLFVAVSLTKRTRVELGRVKISNTVVKSASLTDIFNHYRTINFNDTVESGVVALGVKHHMKRGLLSFYVMPWQDREDNLPAYSRFYGPWKGYASLVARSFQENVAQDKIDAPSIDNWSYLLKYDLAMGKTRAFVSAYYGHEMNSITQSHGALASTVNVVRPFAVDVMGGIAYNMNKNMQLFSEALFQRTEHGLDDKFYQVLFGAKGYFRKLVATATFSNDHRLKKADNTSVLQSSNASRKVLNAYSLLLEYYLRPEMRLSAGDVRNYHDKGNYFFTGVDYTPFKRTVLSLMYSHYTGPTGSVFGSWDTSNNVNFTAKYRF